MPNAEKLQETLATLREILDPYRVGEEVTICLRHDTGMRLASTLMEGLPPVEMPAELSRLASEIRLGKEMYELNLAGVRFEWPGRRINLGSGNSRYI